MFFPAKRWAWGSALALFFISPLFAAESGLPYPPVTVEMAAPPMEGTVSIGVFNQSGQCIRVLFKNVPQTAIPSALNGFSITWDGRINGSPAVKGEYEIRGVVVGAIKIEGVAYHFNDWIDPDQPENPPFQTRRIALLPDGDFLAIQELADHQIALIRYSPEGKARWLQPMSDPMPDLAICPAGAWLGAKGQISTLNLENGRLERWPETFPNVNLLVANDLGLFASVADQLVSIDPATHQMRPAATLPAEIKRVAARGKLLLVTDGSGIYQLAGDRFEKLNVVLSGAVLDLEIGKDGEFWVVGTQNSLTEFNLQGEALRNLEPENGETFTDVAANAEDTRLAVISKKLLGEQTRLLELTAAPTGNVSLWKTKIEKEIQPVGEFSVDSQTLRPMAQGALPSDKTVSISLVENPLVLGKPATQSVTAASMEGGIWVVTADGLPLFPVVSSSKSERQILLRSKKPRELSLFAAIGGAVAEFSLRGLENMMQFSSDAIQWPPGPKQKADEDQVPEKAPAPTPE